MVTFRRCLGLVLTVWLLVSRPSTGLQSGSPDSRWWGTKESAQIRESARKEIQAGNYASAEALFAECKADAARARDRVSAVRCLSGQAGTRMARYDYQGALSIYLQSRDSAELIGDWTDLAAADSNLSSLYHQIFDFGSALRASDEALSAIRKAGNPYFMPQLLVQSGRVHASLEKSDAESLLEEGIRSAQDAEQKFPDQNFGSVEALGWDLLGETRLAHGDLARADQAHAEALRLRRLYARRDLGYSFARLGNVRVEQAEAEQDPGRKRALLREASVFTADALRERNSGASSMPLYQLSYQHARILLASGDVPAGMQEFENALDLAEHWLSGVPDATALLDLATAGMEERVIRTFVRTATEYGLQTHDRRWIAEGFHAAELDRALGLNEIRALADVWRRKLPIEFWETLSKLRAEEAASLRAGGPASPVSQGLRLRLTEMESQAGLGFSQNRGESFSKSDSLSLFGKRLRDSEVLLSFDLETGTSFLWAVTRSTLNAYRLPPKEQIADAVREYRSAIEEGRSDSAELGRKTYRLLLGQLRPEEASKHDWLLSLDDALFELPFAALVPDGNRPVAGREGSEPETEGEKDIVYLAEEHSVEVIPGAFAARPASPAALSGGFVGVGDPVYNIADPRWSGSWSGQHARTPGEWFSTGADFPAQFNRLPGSGREVEASAHAWSASTASVQAGAPSPAVLEGTDARRGRFLENLAPVPAVIHLATHVFTPPGEAGRAFIAFALNPAAEPEFLTTTDIAMLHVPGAVVAMTGCQSAAGDPRPGVGLQGLTRAWSIAGARAVVATLWHVQDSGGRLFASFYQHLHDSTAAEALRLGQVAMIHSGTPLSAPSAWASYQVFQGGQ